MQLETLSLKSGLYLISTPIGNLGDISIRALKTLNSVDLVLCEDKRVTSKLLSTYGIKTKLQTYNDHASETDRIEVAKLIQQGQSVALVSDAGTPLISDPGYKLVQLCHSDQLYVTTLPGANAPLSAIQLSGFPSDRLAFLGFLPHKEKARRDILTEWRNIQTTLIWFESAKRLSKTLLDLADICPHRDVAIVREITKLYEEVLRGSAIDLHEKIKEKPLKGEIVIVLSPPHKEEFTQHDIDTTLKRYIHDMSIKDAAAKLAHDTGLSKKDIYNRALELKEE